MLGMSTYRGDISKEIGNNPVAGSRVNPTLGAYYRYKMSSLFSFRGQIQWGRISGDDKNTEDPGRRARNLHFRSDLFEFAGIAEVHVLDIKDFGRTGRYNVFFNVYGFTGIAITYFEPMAKTDAGEWVKLRPLMTEGKSYENITPAIPIGVGSHFTFDRKWRLGAEVGFRFTLTDYLDDISQNYLTWEEYEEVEPLTYEMSVRYDYDYIASRPDVFPDGYGTPAGGKGGGVRGSDNTLDSYLFATANVGFLLRGKSNFYRARYQFTKGRTHKKRRARAKF